MAPAAGGAPREIVVLLHGYGSNGGDLIAMAPLWRMTMPSALFVAPNGPERCQMGFGGYQWWGLTSFSLTDLAAGVRRAGPVLDAYLDELLAETGLPADRLLLAGFSQGTMMALHVGPRRAAQVAGIIGYSGMLADPQTRADEIRSKPPVLLVHGTADPVVPIRGMREAGRELRRLGLPVEDHETPGLGHMVDPTGLARGDAFARRVLGV